MYDIYLSLITLAIMTDGFNRLSLTLSSKIDIFEDAFNHHYNRLFFSAVKKLQSEDLAKDILQETFIAFWDSLDSITTEKDVLPYLYGILRNKVLMQYRKSEIHLKYAMDSINYQEHVLSSEHIFLNKELEEIINNEVNKMPLRMQAIYRFKKESNYSVKEIAEELSISEQTVKNQLQNAYTRLKSCLKDYNSPAIIVGFVISHMPVLLHR